MRFLPTLILIGVLLASAGMLVLTNIESSPVIGLSSGSGNVGLQIGISGSGFLPTDTACYFSSPSNPGVVTSSACVTSGGSVSGGFTIGNVLPGAYVIQATGSGGDFAQALLTVTGGAQVGLSPATAQPGVDVLVIASGFLPTDTTCTISSSTPNVVLKGTVACVIQAGSGTPHGSFIVGNILPGQYVIQVTGSGGDSAQALLSIE